jgi:hypothetical protein
MLVITLQCNGVCETVNQDIFVWAAYIGGREKQAVCRHFRLRLKMLPEDQCMQETGSNGILVRIHEITLLIRVKNKNSWGDATKEICLAKDTMHTIADTGCMCPKGKVLLGKIWMPSRDQPH